MLTIPFQDIYHTMHSTGDYENEKKTVGKVPIIKSDPEYLFLLCPNPTPNFLRMEINIFFMAPKALRPHGLSKNVSVPTSQDRKISTQRPSALSLLICT